MKLYRIKYVVRGNEYSDYIKGKDGKDAFTRMLERFGIHDSTVQVQSIVEVG